MLFYTYLLNINSMDMSNNYGYDNNNNSLCHMICKNISNNILINIFVNFT